MGKPTEAYNRAAVAFVEDIMGGMPQCFFCARASGNGTCEAYPDGIPLEILANEVDHHEPYEGDGGLSFKPKGGAGGPTNGRSGPGGPTEEKGGKGSGNWGHHGAPGRGGSSRGTGAASNIWAYERAKRQAAIAKSPAAKAVDDAFRGAMREKFPDADDDKIETDVEMLHAALQLGADRFDYYGPKYGVDPSLKEAYYTDIATIDNALARRIYQVKQDATAKSPETGKPCFTVHDDPEKDRRYHADLVGKDYQEAEQAFFDKFGVNIRDRTAGGLGGDIEPEVRHRNASAMYNAASDNAVLTKVLQSGHVAEISYEAPRSSGDTAWATWDGSRITVKGMDWGGEGGSRRYPFPAGLFVHEMGHAVESYARGQGITSGAAHFRTFGRGKTVSDYGWTDAGEDFAETFRAWAVGDPAAGYRDWTPRKFAYMDNLAQEVLK